MTLPQRYCLDFIVEAWHELQTIQLPTGHEACWAVWIADYGSIAIPQMQESRPQYLSIPQHVWFLSARGLQERRLADYLTFYTIHFLQPYALPHPHVPYHFDIGLARFGQDSMVQKGYVEYIWGRWHGRGYVFDYSPPHIIQSKEWWRS